MSEMFDRAVAGGACLLGFDFAIGIPSAFAAAVGAEGFEDFILRADDSLYLPVKAVEEVSTSRPFLAQMPRGSSEMELRRQLGLTEETQLRLCERATAYRGAASCLFMPKAFKQVAGATRTGWREVIRPALKRRMAGERRLRLWPYDGELKDLVVPGNVVVGETYPAELYSHLGLEGNSKRSLEWRRAQSNLLIQAAEGADVEMSPELLQEVHTGFADGRKKDGEDRFDALVGALGLVRIALGLDCCEAPAGDAVRKIEGWIMGMPVSAGAGHPHDDHSAA